MGGAGFPRPAGGDPCSRASLWEPPVSGKSPREATVGRLVETPTGGVSEEWGQVAKVPPASEEGQGLGGKRGRRAPELGGLTEP